METIRPKICRRQKSKKAITGASNCGALLGQRRSKALEGYGGIEGRC